MIILDINLFLVDLCSLSLTTFPLSGSGNDSIKILKNKVERRVSGHLIGSGPHSYKIILILHSANSSHTLAGGF